MHTPDAPAAVTCLSDSPSKLSERHQPVEIEADLASLLMAKEPFSLDKIAPDSVDSDYEFFEKVLLFAPKM